jgi:hypothetical protein
MKIDFARFNRAVLRLTTVNLVADAACLVNRFCCHTMFNILHRTIMQDFPVRNLSTLSASTRVNINPRAAKINLKLSRDKKHIQLSPVRI